MTTFNDREKAQEAKFVREEEMAFRVTARRNASGQWAASRMGSYAGRNRSLRKERGSVDFEEVGDEDVIRKLLGDLTGAQVETSDEEIRQALADDGRGTPATDGVDVTPCQWLRQILRR